MIRFYKHVGIREAKGGDYEVTLDGYPLKTPGTEKPYRIPTRGLALAVALEWDQQVGTIDEAEFNVHSVNQSIQGGSQASRQAKSKHTSK